MNRLFSVFRRRPNLVDLYIPITAGATGYRVETASNFDAAFTTKITTNMNGIVDPSINPMVIESQPTFGRYVRVVFNPTTISATDTAQIWLRVVPLTGTPVPGFPGSGGAAGTAGAASLLLPDSYRHGIGQVIITGQAPSAGPLQIDLPTNMQDFHIVNKDAGTNVLLVATAEGGPQYSIYPASGVSQLFSLFGTQGSLYVQGSGGNVNFSANFTLAFPR